MNDYLIRGTALDGRVRAFGVVTTKLTEELKTRHHASPTAIAALGRLAAAGLMMGAMLKNEEKLTIQIKGDGPIGQVVVDANAKGEVRGYVDAADVELPLNSQGKLDVSQAIGKDGFLYVIKDLGLKEPYRGSVPIISGEIAEDITYYFAKSEQTPSAVALGVLVNMDYTIKVAGGMMIQLLPGLSEEEITDIEQMLVQVTSLTTELESGRSIEEVLRQILPTIQFFDKQEVKFRCKCSIDRVEQTLLSLGKSELESILAEDGCAQLTCHFCNQQYNFNRDNLIHLIEKI